jgi:hypothetical protein
LNNEIKDFVKNSNEYSNVGFLNYNKQPIFIYKRFTTK